MSYPQSLKLLLTTRAIADGGAERVWLTIARALAARGAEVILAIDDTSTPCGLDATTNPRLVSIGGSHALGVVALARLLARERPDVALAAVSGSCAKLAAAKLLTRSATPIVLSYHGFEEWRTGRLAASAYLGLPIGNAVAARIVAVSDGLAHCLIDRWGADPAKTRRIYNPVSLDLAAAAASAEDLAMRAPIVTAIGRLSVEKGVIDLVEAFARLERPQARLVIGGDGPERARIEARVRALGLDARVRLLGQVDPIEHYRRARVVAIPSRTEAFGLVVAEALAHGLPIVATDCAGPREILGEGRWGRIVPIGDADAMAHGLAAALDDPGVAAARIARAAEFSLEKGVDAWARLVDEVAAEHAAGRRGRG
jgi:glycosyltransferase involved in cell wall biosynthesis